MAEIREAARLLAGVAVRTPLVPFPGLGRELLVKPESLQPTGSFKLRGAYTAISAAGVPGHGVVAHSSGYHGHAVAYAPQPTAVILNKVRDGKGNYGYNAATGEFGDLIEQGILDPTKVTRLALQNAASVVGSAADDRGHGCRGSEGRGASHGMPPGGGMGGMDM